LEIIPNDSTLESKFLGIESLPQTLAFQSLYLWWN